VTQRDGDAAAQAAADLFEFLERLTPAALERRPVV
jgi:hypothetical protein